MALTDGLLVYLPGSESSGTRTDLHNSKAFSQIGSVAVGSATGHVYSLAADVERDGTNTSALERSGDTELDLGDNDLTIGIWFKVEDWDTIGVGFGAVLVNKTGGGIFEYRVFVFNVDGVTHTFAGGTYGEGTFPSISALTDVVAGVWHLGFWWYDAVNGLMWVQLDNDTPQSASTAGGLQTTAPAIALGCTSSLTTTQQFDGSYLPFMLWDRQLTTEERSEAWNDGDGLPYADFVEDVVTTRPQFTRSRRR